MYVFRWLPPPPPPSRSIIWLSIFAKEQPAEKATSIDGASGGREVGRKEEGYTEAGEGKGQKKRLMEEEKRETASSPLTAKNIDCESLCDVVVVFVWLCSLVPLISLISSALPDLRLPVIALGDAIRRIWPHVGTVVGQSGGEK